MQQSFSGCIIPFSRVHVQLMFVNQQLFRRNHQPCKKNFTSGKWDILNILLHKKQQQSKQVVLKLVHFLIPNCCPPPPSTTPKYNLSLPSHGPTALKSSCREFNCWRFTPLHNAHIRGCSPLTYMDRETVVLNLVRQLLKHFVCAPPTPHTHTHACIQTHTHIQTQ